MKRHVLAIALLCASQPALAQLALPGATAPAPIGTVVTPRAAKPKAKTRVRIEAATVPEEVNLAGKTLALNGGKSQIGFSPHDKTVDLSHLLLAGTKLSNSRDECQVDVAGMPLPLTPLGKVNGLLRFSIPIPACPLTFDVLHGAVLVAAQTPKCSFKEADCEVVPNGLWGASPGDLGPGEVKTLERERTQAERDVRSAYKGLVASTKDRPTIKGFASDQAGFSSYREETCRDYIGELRHGFCALRLTQARAVALETELIAANAAKEERKKRLGKRSRAE